MTKERMYWLCQVFGWTSFILYEIMFYSVRTALDFNLILNGLVNIPLGIGLTHAYRNLILQWRWADLPFQKLVYRAMLSLFCMTACLTLANILLDRILLPNLIFDLDFIAIFGYFGNIGKYLLVWVLLYHLFLQYEKHLRTETEVHKLNSLVQENRYQSLKSQLNPHFLFNSLNSIRALIYEDPQKAQQSITRLSDLLRRALNITEKREVNLQEELKAVEDYLALESIRFEDRLQLSWNISAATQNLKIPPMMLQTLVENAVKHGISRLKSGGILSIRSFITEDQQEWGVEILNSGTYTPNEQSIDHSGVGLVNTRQRLDLIYAGKAKLYIQNKSDGIVETLLLLPYAQNPDS